MRVRRLSGPVMGPAFCEDLHRRLSGLVILLEPRMKSEDANLICHFVEVGEYGLALEELADHLALAGTPITDQERNDMMALTAKMQMDDNVLLTLAFCPRVI